MKPQRTTQLATILLICFVTLFCFVAFGCALVDKSSSKIAEGVNKYCEDVDAETRKAIRAEVNSKTAPNTVIITCGADG